MSTCFHCGQPIQESPLTAVGEPWVHVGTGVAYCEPTRSVEQSKRGEWHWFCLRDDCHWSGAGLFSEAGANREADRHDREFHP